MNVTSFDTLAYHHALVEAGFSSAQAEAQTQALAKALSVSIENLATKPDLSVGLSELRSEMNLKFAEAKEHRSLLSQDIRNLENRLTLRLGGIIVVSIGFFAALVKFF